MYVNIYKDDVIVHIYVHYQITKEVIRYEYD